MNNSKFSVNTSKFCNKVSNHLSGKFSTRYFWNHQSLFWLNLIWRWQRNKHTQIISTINHNLIEIMVSHKLLKCICMFSGSWAKFARFVTIKSLLLTRSTLLDKQRRRQRQTARASALPGCKKFCYSFDEPIALWRLTMPRRVSH